MNESVKQFFLELEEWPTATTFNTPNPPTFFKWESGCYGYYITKTLPNNHEVDGYGYSDWKKVREQAKRKTALKELFGAVDQGKSFIPVNDERAIGEAIRNMRFSLYQTQGYMADLFGIPVSQWSALENMGREDQ